MSDRQLFSNPDTEALSVGSVFRRSKNALARDFRGQIWVEAEIKFMKDSQRGHWYLTLVDPGDFTDGSDIQLDVFVWAKRRRVIEAKLQDAGIRLAVGMMVRVQGTVGISKLGKLQVELSDLDTEALIGRQANEKKRLVQALRAEGLMDANKALTVPLVPLRVGLVTSEGSEGFNDFVGQLERSPFAFSIALVHSAVQGPTAPNTLARAIASFDPRDVDVICVVRGGGGELDAFDKEPVVRAIATSPIAVWTGIGHTGDRAVADEVAQRCFITPTECGQGVVAAVGEYADRVRVNARRLSRLVERELDAESRRVTNVGRGLRQAVNSHLDRSAVQLHRAGERVHRSAERDLVLATASVDRLRRDLTKDAARLTASSADALQRMSLAVRTATERRVQELSIRLGAHRAQLSAFDPKQQLRRGYSITRTADGQMVREASDLTSGARLLSTFAWGSASSTVTDVHAEES